MTATLSERLGYGADARLLILNADELGFCHAANVGVYESLRSGGATSASLMVPCPWGREAAARYRGEDVGVHLTLNAEQELYRWGPITHAPSLLGGDAGFPATVEDVWDHADLDETRRECRAQIERAILWGFDVSHLDAHLTTLQLRPEFFDIYLELALDFQLPLRMVEDHLSNLLGFPAAELARREGAVFSDRSVTLSARATLRTLDDTLAELQPGVTELHLRPAVDSPELRSLTADWSTRVGDHELLCGTPSLRQIAEKAGVQMIGFRALRDLARRA
ncbi:MAG: polysaccharide deacetylase family protein [Acidimicrobiales bacterium]